MPYAPALNIPHSYHLFAVSLLTSSFLPTKDLFVFKVVNAVFGKLGINDDRVALQRYFGEWCDGTLPTRAVVESNVVRSEGTWRPMVR